MADRQIRLRQPAHRLTRRQLHRPLSTAAPGAEPAIESLTEALDEDFPSSRVNACWTLGYLEAKQALDHLEELAESDSSEEVRHAAEFALSEIQDTET